MKPVEPEINTDEILEALFSVEMVQRLNHAAALLIAFTKDIGEHLEYARRSGR